jgi:hypothetical protein
LTRGVVMVAGFVVREVGGAVGIDMQGVPRDGARRFSAI